jgi:hypothetical protein
MFLRWIYFSLSIFQVLVKLFLQVWNNIKLDADVEKVAASRHLVARRKLSAHDVTMGDIIIPFSQEEVSSKDYSSSYSEFIVKKPKWEEEGKEGYQIETARILQGLFDNYDKVEDIPTLCAMFSKALVISAENNFETSNPKQKMKKKKLPQFSDAYKQAQSDHKNVCDKWRQAGRPSDESHPAKQAVLNSRRNLQRVGRNDEASDAIKLHDDLMNTFDTDRNKIYDKLKKSRGNDVHRIAIPYIDTLVGKYEGNNVLEGFCANTEVLCNEESNDLFGEEFYRMSTNDKLMISDITADEHVSIPHINIAQLKHILFKKLKVNKACDVFKVTVEHLRNAGDKTLLLILKLLNSIIDNVNFLSSPQLNTSVASVVYKGKGKPLSHHKSYRLVRVTPLFARLIDEHMSSTDFNVISPASTFILALAP